MKPRVLHVAVSPYQFVTAVCTAAVLTCAVDMQLRHALQYVPGMVIMNRLVPGFCSLAHNTAASGSLPGRTHIHRSPAAAVAAAAALTAPARPG